MLKTIVLLSIFVEIMKYFVSVFFNEFEVKINSIY